MQKIRKTTRTMVGRVNDRVLAFTAGRDRELDALLVEADCIGSAAHAKTLAKVPVRPSLFTEADVRKVVSELAKIMKDARKGEFAITARDQDVHLAVERVLTGRLGELGRKIHTARSRNDQVAVDLRLYGKEQLLKVIDEVVTLVTVLLSFASKHETVPMVGRTHFQPAMPSSVGLWASAHAESLMDDVGLLKAAYEFNDRCPLGSAAGYGVPLKIDRNLTARLLGFERPVHNVLYASNARGKCEAVILSALVQVMLSLSRLAEDMILYSAPEFGYFSLPPEYCTGSSIMPQKNNPDVLELVRARASRVLSDAVSAAGTVKGLAGGYNRDLQETKEPFMDGLRVTRSCLQVLALLMGKVKVDRKALLAGFTPDVFATDHVMELVADGMSFREAYDHVKKHLFELMQVSAEDAVMKRTHLGGPGRLGLDELDDRMKAEKKFVISERGKYYSAISRLLGMKYPELV